MDPTISRPDPPERSAADVWWIEDCVDLAATRHLDHAAWVRSCEDLPRLESLAGPYVHDAQSWLALSSFPMWSEYGTRSERDDPYRSTWVHLVAYLVPESHFARAVKALKRRNFFGKWLPEGARWLYPFVGEYPWASACNIETDDWRGFQGTLEGTTIPMTQAYNEVTCEWEYDGSLPRSLNFHVPARNFFEGEALHWDGVDGYRRADGKTVFRDPSASEGGPSTLLADREHLLLRLDAMGCRLVWTLLGEKQVLSERNRRAPQVTYSQIAHLEKDGELVVGDRVFFENYDKDQGPARPRRSQTTP